MRIATSLLLGLLSLSCSGRGPTQGDPVVLPRGEGIYTARYNPVACADPEAYLGVEVRTPLGWERVRLEDSDVEQKLAPMLLKNFEANPHSTRLVRGDFTARAWAFGNGHGSRVFRLTALDPVPSADDPNRSISQ